MTDQPGKPPKTPAPDDDAWQSQDAPQRSGESSVIWTIWLTYGAFYFCRTNISAAVPGLRAPLDDGGMGLSGEEVGWILASLKITYGLGQFINGQLSERVSPRILLAIGMFCSAALNALFGVATGFYFLLFIWACNGYFQSLGWTPCVRVIGNWIPILRRGKAIGIVGTGYQITLGLTYLIAGRSAEILGWRGAMYVPAILLAATGVFMLFFLREQPDDESADQQTSDEYKYDESPKSAPPKRARATLTENLFWTLFNPALWLLGLSLGLLNACRYGFLDWGISHLMDVQKTSVGSAGLKFFVIAVGAAAGSYLAGWAADRIFGGRRAPVIVILLLLLGGLSLTYEAAARSSVGLTMILLVVIGFCIYGPQVLLVGTAPADLAHRGTSAAAAGFVNFMGYMGAAMGDVVTGYYSDEQHGGWKVAIYIWAGWAFAASAATAVLWNTTSRRVGLLHSAIPKLVILLAWSTALTVSLANSYSAALQALPALGLLAAAAACRMRQAAIATLCLSLVGAVSVFILFVVLQSGLGWHPSVSLTAYGLAILASVMLLVERRS